MSFQGFFWFCSGASLPLLKRSPTDHIKYAGIGATVFFTGIFAALSGGYALFYVFNNLEPTGRWTASLGFGILWGAMIFNLDRYIVSSMKKKNGFWSEFRMALPRFFLAAVIALVISKPLELQIFHSTIEAELQAMHQEDLKRMEGLVLSRYTPEIEALKNQISDKETAMKEKSDRRDQLENEARKEADGTGGSQKRGAKTIYRIKRADADKAQAELDSFLRKTLPLVETFRTRMEEKQTEADSAKSAVLKTAPDGFDQRLEALGRVTRSNSTLALASWFLMLLFVTIELCPVLVKLLSPRGPYDDFLEQHEHAAEIFRIEKISIRNHATNQKLDRLSGRLATEPKDNFNL